MTLNGHWASAFNCFISQIGIFLRLCLKGLVFKIDKKGFAKSNIGHLNEIFGYLTLKLLRSYSASKGQEKVEMNRMRK